MLVNKREMRFRRAGRGVQLGLDPKARHPGPVLDPALRASKGEQLARLSRPAPASVLAPPAGRDGGKDPGVRGVRVRMFASPWVPPWPQSNTH